jgi:hypothetical protein
MADDLTSLSGEAREGRGALSSDGAVFDILQNDRRRMVILALANRESGIPVDELAESIAINETGDENPPEKAYKSAYVALQQTHVPKMSDAGVARYDQQTGVLYPGPNFDDVRVYLEDRPDERRHQLSAELGLGLAGLIATVGSLLGVPLLSLLPVEYWAIFFLTAVFLVNAYRYVAE